MSKESLTNEKVSRRFISLFELVNYAISLAKNMIASGRTSRVDTHVQNKAYQILLEIADNKDLFDNLADDEDEDEETLPSLEEMLRKTMERKERE